MPTTNTFVSILLAPFLISAIFIFFQLKFKLKRGTTEFQILLLVCGNMLILLELAMIVLNFFQGNLAVTLTLYPIAILFTFYVFLYIIKEIRSKESTITTQASNIFEILQMGASSSVNVADIAADLISSSSEVSASAEQIVSTTQITTKNVNEQAINLSEINEMANDIKMITQLITDISKQTNLLALNASIEAGRAGEYGSGFAIVAEKVQALAEQSKNSVEKTNKIISGITQKIEQSSNVSMELSHAMNEISAAVQEQTAALDEITSTINQLGTHAQELKDNLNKYKDINFSEKLIKK